MLYRTSFQAFVCYNHSPRTAHAVWLPLVIECASNASHTTAACRVHFKTRAPAAHSSAFPRLGAAARTPAAQPRRAAPKLCQRNTQRLRERHQGARNEQRVATDYRHAVAKVVRVSANAAVVHYHGQPADRGQADTSGPHASRDGQQPPAHGNHGQCQDGEDARPPQEEALALACGSVGKLHARAAEHIQPGPCEGA